MEIMRRLVQEEEGQGLVEYALIIALISIVAIASLKPVGTWLTTTFGGISTELAKP